MVFIKPAVFGGYQGVYKMGGNLCKGYQLDVLGGKPSQFLAIPVVDHAAFFKLVQHGEVIGFRFFAVGLQVNVGSNVSANGQKDAAQEEFFNPLPPVQWFLPGTTARQVFDFDVDEITDHGA